jgi:hypothetical protein
MSDAFLEALKAMGRMDGDGIDCAGEARTIEAWRRECELLRGQVSRLEAERAKLISEYNDRVFERDKSKDECESLNADRRGDVIAGENEALRIIVRHLSKLL